MKIFHQIEQLEQLKSATWDGDLISKTCRDDLREYGYCTKSAHGWNIITPAGLDCLHALGRLSTNRINQVS